MQVSIFEQRGRKLTSKLTLSESWSGRWESNPRPKLRKLLKILVSCLYFASNCVQLQRVRHIRHRLFRDSAAEMNISEGGSGISVTELSLRNFRPVPSVHDERGHRVTKRMKSAPRNFQ